MNTKIFNFAFMILWLGICVGLLTRDLWMPPELLDRATGPNTPMIILVTGILALWNFMRFWIAFKYSGPTQVSPEVAEYRRKIRGMSEEPPKVVNPEFRFDNAADPPPDGRS